MDPSTPTATTDAPANETAEGTTEGTEATTEGAEGTTEETKVKKTRRNLNVDGLPTPSPEQFTDAWNEADTKQGAVDILTEAGMYISYNSALQRERDYRKAGIKLKSHGRASSPKSLDVEGLNARITKRQEEREAEAKAAADAEGSESTKEGASSES